MPNYKLMVSVLLRKPNSVEKVIAYLVLGIVLLVISFLYQKYKKIIFGIEDL